MCECAHKSVSYALSASVPLQMSGGCSLAAVISDLQSAQPAEAQGHLWTRTFPRLSPAIILLFVVLFSSPPAILSCCDFLRLHSPLCVLCICTTPRLQPKPCPPLTLRLYQLIHSFCYPSAGLVSPVSLYLCFACRSQSSPFVSLPPSLPSLWFPSILLRPLPEKHRAACLVRTRMCTASQRYIHTSRYLREHACHERPTRTHTHTLRSPHVILMKLFQGPNLTDAFNWTNKKVILSFN